MGDLAQYTWLDAIRDGKVSAADAAAQLRDPTLAEKAGGLGEDLVHGVADGFLNGSSGALRTLQGVLRAGANQPAAGEKSPVGEMLGSAGAVVGRWADQLGGEKPGLRQDIEAVRRGGSVGSTPQLANAGGVYRALDSAANMVGQLTGTAALPGGLGRAAMGIKLAFQGGAQGYYEAEAKGAGDEAKWTAFALDAGLGGATAEIPGAAANTLGKVFARADRAGGGGLSKMLWEGVKSGGATLDANLLQQIGANEVAAGLYDEDRQVLQGVLDAGQGGPVIVGLLTGMLGARGGARPGMEEQIRSGLGGPGGEPVDLTGRKQLGRGAMAMPERAGNRPLPQLTAGGQHLLPERTETGGIRLPEGQGLAVEPEEIRGELVVGHSAETVADTLGVPIERVKAIEERMGEENPAETAGPLAAREEIARLREEHKAALSTPLMSEGAISPTQVNRMSKGQFEKWQSLAQERMTVEARIRDLRRSPEEIGAQDEAEERKGLASRLNQIKSYTQTLEQVGRVGKSGKIRPKYRAEIDKLDTERAGIEAQLKSPLTLAEQRRARITALDEQIKGTMDELGRAGKTARATGIDTDVLKLVTRAAKEHIQRAGLTFDDFVRTHIEKFGEKVRPYLKQAWDIASAPEKGKAARAMPERIDRWIGERDEAKAVLMSAGKRVIEATNALHPGKPAEAKLAREAMLHYIDTKGRVEEEVRAHGMPPDPHDRAVFERSMQLSGPERAIADRIITDEAKAGIEGKRALAASFGGESEGAGVEKAWRENHIRRYWEAPRVKAGPAGTFNPKPGTLKQRTYSSVLEGFKRGRKLAVTDVALAHAGGMHELRRGVADATAMRDMESSGLISRERHDGWELVERPFRNYPFDYYAPPEVAKAINAVVGQSKIKGGFADRVGKFQKAIKRTKFLASAFHPFAFQAATTLASPGALKNANPFYAYRAGKQAILEMGPALRGGAREGLVLGGSSDLQAYQKVERSALVKRIDAIPGLGDARQKIVAAMDASQRWIFDELGPALKAHFFALERQRLLHEGKTEKQANRVAASLANDTFGGLNLARMGRDPTRQHVFHLLALAPDWTESNLRNAARAFQRGDDGAAHRALWGRVAVRGAAALILGNAMMAAFDDDTFMDRYAKAWKADPMKALDIDITPLYKAAGGKDGGRKYLSILRQFLFVPKMVAGAARHGVFSSTENKAAPIAQSLLEAVKGTDWKGAPFTSTAEATGKFAGQTASFHSKQRAPALKPEQVPSFLAEQVKNYAPIQVTNLLELLNGQFDAFDTVARGLGLEETNLRKKKR